MKEEEREEREGVPKQPSSGVYRSGSNVSALIPQTIVVSPSLINELPIAVDTDPSFLKRKSVRFGSRSVQGMREERTNVDTDVPPGGGLSFSQLSSIRSVSLG